MRQPFTGLTEKKTYMYHPVAYAYTFGHDQKDRQNYSSTINGFFLYST